MNDRLADDVGSTVDGCSLALGVDDDDSGRLNAQHCRPDVDRLETKSAWEWSAANLTTAVKDGVTAH